MTSLYKELKLKNQQHRIQISTHKKIKYHLKLIIMIYINIIQKKEKYPIKNSKIINYKNWLKKLIMILIF